MLLLSLRSYPCNWSAWMVGALASCTHAACTPAHMPLASRMYARLHSCELHCSWNVCR